MVRTTSAIPTNGRAAALLGAGALTVGTLLSTQLAAMDCTSTTARSTAPALISAPGTTSANALGFHTINAVLAEASTSLGTNGLTVAAGPERSHQEALKNALDRANNNKNFVQATPAHSASLPRANQHPPDRRRANRHR